jgi:hypothetical protein
MRLVITPMLVVVTVAACRTDGLDTKLSTELQQARLVVLDWPPHPDSTAPSTTKPPHTACALHLLDEVTGTRYQVSRTHRTRPDGGSDDPSTWPETGDYSVHRAGGRGNAGDARVRIECGTWKILGLVSARSDR